MNEDQLRFKKLLGFGIRIQERYLHTLSALKLFDEFNKLSSSNIVGKKRAEENVKIFNKYSYFILASKESLRVFLLIELAKFFDEDTREQNLSIRKILNYANKKIDSFSIDQFHKYHKERRIIPEIFENFKALTEEDLNKINRRLTRNKDKIKLGENGFDYVVDEDTIIPQEIKETTAREVLNFYELTNWKENSEIKNEINNSFKMK